MRKGSTLDPSHYCPVSVGLPAAVRRERVAVPPATTANHNVVAEPGGKRGKEGVVELRLPLLVHASEMDDVPPTWREYSLRAEVGRRAFLQLGHEIPLELYDPGAPDVPGEIEHHSEPRHNACPGENPPCRHEDLSADHERRDHKHDSISHDALRYTASDYCRSPMPQLTDAIAYFITFCIISQMSDLSRKILVILGPTASGKSDLALRLAKLAQSKPFQKKYGISGAEIISADSRQVYRGLDIGTGKVPRDRSAYYSLPTTYSYKGIPHYLLDVASPKKQFSVADYQKLGRKALKTIWAKNKLPIICGGTGLYIDALINNTSLPNVPPDPKLRAKLEKLSVTELFEKLQKLDPARAKNIDQKNPRRLIRALEIVLKTGAPVPDIILRQAQDKISQNKILKLGIGIKPEKLRERIRARLIKRMRQGMLVEVKKLHQDGLSWRRMEELGLEYRYLSRYLRGLITKEEMLQKLETEIWRYAKRQMTWWKKDKNIVWIEDKNRALQEVKKLF